MARGVEPKRIIWQLFPQAATRKLVREISAWQRVAQGEGWGRVLAAFLQGKFFHPSSEKPELDWTGRRVCRVPIQCTALVILWRTCLPRPESYSLFKSAFSAVDHPPHLSWSQVNLLEKGGFYFGNIHLNTMSACIKEKAFEESLEPFSSCHSSLSGVPIRKGSCKGKGANIFWMTACCQTLMALYINF